MMFLYSSTVVFNWAFCSKMTSFSAAEDVELFESPFTALLFKLLFSTSLQLFRWLLLVTLLAVEELVLVLRLDLLLTSCSLRFSSALSSHFEPSPSLIDDVASGKCCVNRSFTFFTSTLGWVWNERKFAEWKMSFVKVRGGQIKMGQKRGWRNANERRHVTLNYGPF